MPLPIEVEKAIADEKSKRGYGNEHDLAELMEKQKAPPPKEEKKEEKKEEAKKEDEPLGKVATELLSKRLGYTRKTKKEEDEKKEEKPEAGEGDEKGGEGGKGAAELEKPKGDDEEVSTTDAKSGDDKSKPKAKISKKPDIDPIEIASAAAARTAQSFMESAEASRQKATDQGAAKGVEDALSDEEKGELEVFREMSKDPKFKELPRQYLAYLKKAEDYQRQWEKDHPTEEFNPDANDHDQFYAKHQPKYSELEYKKAIVRMESKAASSHEIEKLTKEQKRLQSELAVREIEPVINQTSIGALAEVIKGIDENILKAIEKDGFQKYSEVNAVEADLISEVAGRLGPFIRGILQFDDPDGRIPFNEKNADHVAAVRYLREKEEEIRKKPMRERLTDDGKVIVPRGEFFKMTDAQKQSHAYLDTQMLIQLRIAEEADNAKAQYAKELKKAEARAKALGWSPPSRTENGHKAKEEKAKKEEKPEEIQEESRSPEAGSSSRVDTSGEVKKGASKDLTDLTADILFQRR